MRVSLCLAKENEDCAVLEKTAWVYIERLDIVICHQPLRAFPPWARGGHPLPEKLQEAKPTGLALEKTVGSALAQGAATAALPVRQGLRQ